MACPIILITIIYDYIVQYNTSNCIYSVKGDSCMRDNVTNLTLQDSKRLYVKV